MSGWRIWTYRGMRTQFRDFRRPRTASGVPLDVSEGPYAAASDPIL
jgi:hypothetical protein